MIKYSIFEKKSVMIATALFCCLLWGSAPPCIKLSYTALGIQNGFQKILLAGLRFTLAGLGVLVFAKVKLKTKVAPTRKEIPFFLLIALLQTFANYSLFYIGLGYTTAVKASILTNLSVFVVAVLSHFVFKSDRLNWKKGFGLLCGFTGIIMVNLTLVVGTSLSFSWMGEGLVTLPSVLTGITMVLVRKNSGNINVVKMNGWQLLTGGAMLIAVGYVGYPHILPFNFASSALLIYMSALSATAFTLWFILLKHHNASTVEQFKFAVPVFGSLFSVVLISNEHFGPEMFLSVALVAIGILIVNKQDKHRI